jgi:hypothetical protein
VTDRGQCADGEKITVDLKNKIAEDAEWIALILGGGYWQAFVNKVIDSRSV